MLKIRSNHQPILNFTIYGERHTGTNFLQSYITESYNIPITWEYGWKHWFGFHDNYIISKGQNTLFLGIVRNPYDWLMSLKRMPHHLRAWSGEMYENPFKDDMDFLTSEIVSYHQGQEIIDDHHIHTHSRYKNIFELREIKNLYLLHNMPSLAANYILINYEILNTNIDQFILTLNNNFNLSLKQFSPNNIIKKPYYISPETRLFINNSINWDTEKQLGYYRICV